MSTDTTFEVRIRRPRLGAVHVAAARDDVPELRRLRESGAAVEHAPDDLARTTCDSRAAATSAVAAAARAARVHARARARVYCSTPAPTSTRPTRATTRSRRTAPRDGGAQPR